MASIGYYDDEDEWVHQCGATLISSKHFLTAAHCLANPTTNMKIHIGEFNYELPKNQLQGKDVRVTEIKIHPSSSGQNAYYDVAVILLVNHIS